MIARPSRCEKFAPAVKHLNAMYATKRAKISLVRDPVERKIREDELKRVVLTARETLSKIHKVFEDIGADVISS
jgi:hypothetical protein